ncbi:TRAP transporter small permease subunit [Limibacter armeniacum]|uniref:TRAP transporter small permease subunit n=1 Tax=Limibacter armeniacum TaxID=466084 RepID=UPI002FE53BA0
MLTTLLSKVVKNIDRINLTIGRSVSWLTTILVILICIDVAARHLFKQASAALPELEWHVFSLIFLLGAGYTLQKDRHVRVDVFYARFSQKAKAWVNLLGSILLLLPFCLLVMDASIPYIKMAYLINEGSTDPGGLPARFLIKGSIFVGFFLLLLQGVSLFCSSLLCILDEKRCA